MKGEIFLFFIFSLKGFVLGLFKLFVSKKIRYFLAGAFFVFFFFLIDYEIASRDFIKSSIIITISIIIEISIVFFGILFLIGAKKEFVVKNISKFFIGLIAAIIIFYIFYFYKIALSILSFLLFIFLIIKFIKKYNIYKKNKKERRIEEIRLGNFFN